MDKFKQTVLSDEFVSAVSDASISGKPINFTTAVASTAVLTDDQTAANSYANSQKFSKDTSGNVSGYNNTDTNTIVISVELNNSGLSADVKVSSIFIYAQYNSKDILVATARLNDPELLPAYNGTPVTLEYELYMTLQKTSNVTVQFNNAGLVTRQEGARIDASAVHITGDETVNGVKSFLQKIKGTIEKADKSDLAAKATQLATSHKIGGLAFDGTQDLTLPGVNAKGNQDTTGLAAKATQLASNRTIKLKGVVNGSATFDGTQDITIATDTTITENNPNADLSTFSSAGNFYVYGTLTNSPISSGYALLQVFKMSGGIVQALTDLQTEKTYTRTNISSKGYGSWILNADDSTVVHNSGSQSIAGSLTIPVDNSMINVGNDAGLAMVKKQGQSGSLVVGNNKPFRVQKSNNATVSPTDTLTDLMLVDPNGVVSANGFKGQTVPLISDEKNVDNIRDSGLYKIDTSYTGVPNGLPNGSFLEVKNFDGNLIFQTIYARQNNDSLKKATIWIRLIFNSVVFNWQSLSKDDDVLHNTGTETAAGDKTFTGNNKFTQLIDGALKTRQATFTDFSQVAMNMITYSGQWHIQDSAIANGPKNDMTWTVVSVITGNGPKTGLIITSTYLENIIYYTTVDNGIIKGWNKLPKDSTLVHNTGDETADGVKTFLKPIQGSIAVRKAPFTDFAVVATKMQTYNGNWYNDGSGTIANAPVTGTYITIEVVSGNAESTGIIRISAFGNSTSYYSVVNNGKLGAWKTIGDDNNAVHKTGDETVGGNKAFSEPLDAVLKLRMPKELDVDNLTVSGTYKISTLFANIPTAMPNGAFLQVFNFDDNAVNQIVVSRDPQDSIKKGVMWIRQKFSGVWGSWYQISRDFNVMHLFNDETVRGKKTFLTSINSDIDGNSATATAPKVQAIPGNSDLNTVKISGFYSIQGGSATNSPVQNYFSLNVITVGAYNGTQVLVDANNGVVWTRSWYSDSKWSDWQNNTNTNVNKIAPTDANNVTQSGTYVFNGSNLPSANDYYVFVTRFDDTKIKQVAMRDYDNATFSRTKIGGVWYDWVPMSTTTPIELSDNYDIINLTTAGQYTSKSGKMVGLPAYPVWGVLEVMNNGVDIIQRFNITSGDPHTFFQRVYASGSWKDWRVF